MPFRLLFPTLLILAFLTSQANAEATANAIDPLAPDLPGPTGVLFPNFTFAGIPGGIPEPASGVSIADFGGLPDDDLPDDGALEAAVEALARQGGGVLRIGPGIYDLRRPLVIKSDGIVLRGAGMDETLLRFDYALQPGEVRLVGFGEGQTLSRDDVIESHTHTRRLKSHKIYIDETLLFERGPDYGGGDRFWLTLPLANYANRLSNGPATVRAVVERWDGTVDETTRQVVLDLDRPLEPGARRYLNSLASIAFVGDSRSDYRGRGILAEDGKRGDRSVRLRQATPFQPGDLVMIEAAPTHGFIKEIGSWRKDIPRKQMLLVESVEGETVVFNQPLRIDYPRRDGAVLYGRKPIRDCGIEGLTLEHTRKKWIDGIRFDAALHCWVRDVRVQKAGRNPLVISEGKQCQVESSEFNEAWFSGGGGTGYLGFSDSWDCLYQDLSATGLRHAPVVQSAASGNVMRRSTFDSSDINYHMQWAPENLIEECTLDARRGTGSYGYAVFAQRPEVAIHGPGGGPRNVIWNNRFKSPKSGVYLGGSNEGWNISYNRFEVESGPGAILRRNSNRHRFEGNAFLLEDPIQPVFSFETDDCTGSVFIDNRSNSRTALVKGLPEGSYQASGNEINLEVPFAAPKAPTPSIYEWQLSLVR